MCESLAQNTWIWFKCVQLAMVLVSMNYGCQITQLLLRKYFLNNYRIQIMSKYPNGHINSKTLQKYFKLYFGQWVLLVNILRIPNKFGLPNLDL